MSDTTTPIAAFNPANRFVTFEGLKDYDANLIRNLHSLGYNNTISGTNIFAWGNHNRIDGQNLFIFGNGFNLTTNQKYPSLFLGNGYALGEWEGAEDTIFGVWGTPSEGPGRPIFRVGAESEEQITAAFSIRNNGSFSAAQNNFIVNADGSFSAANGLFNVNSSILTMGGESGDGQVKSPGTLDLSGKLVRVVDSQFTVLSPLVNTGSSISISSTSPFTVRSVSLNKPVFEITGTGAITTMQGKRTSYVTLKDLLTPPASWGDTSKISVLVVLDG